MLFDDRGQGVRFKMKQIVNKLRPRKFYTSGADVSQKSIFTSFGLQRSGQHLIIEWICRGLQPDAIHFNHCRFFREGFGYKLTPVAGRRVLYYNKTINDSGIQGRENLQSSLPDVLPSNLFFSIEDINPLELDYKKLLNAHKVLSFIVLRDPANWLASGLRHGLHDSESLQRNKDTLKMYLKIALHKIMLVKGCQDVNYNRFCQDFDYRCKLSEVFDQFDLDYAEKALDNTPSFGGGSSFKNKKSSNVFDRWKEYQRDKVFRSILNDRELLELSNAYFGPISPITPLQDIIEQDGRGNA